MSEPMTSMRGDVSEGRFYSGAVKVFLERDTHVPTFCPWQNTTEAEMRAVVVKKDGVPFLPSFTVEEMAPERRWAVKRDGELLDAMAFQTGYTRQWEEWYTVVKRQKIEGRADRHYIPAVDQYVRFRVDPKNRLNPSLVPIAVEKKPSGQKPDHFVDRDGEPIRKPRIDVLVEQYRQDPSRLRREEVLEVRQHLGLEEVAVQPDEEAKKVELAMNELLTLLGEGKIDRDEFVRLSSEVCGREIPVLVSQPKARKAGRKVKVACGREIDARGVRWHVQKCKTCSEAQGAVSQGA